MESLTSSVPAPQASHHDELFMQQRMHFSESLNELKNLRKQLYSAAEYFEVSYSKDDQKQIVVETLKDYTIKAFINTIDHLGSMADKINNFMDENIVEVSGTDLRFRSIEQRVRTCQDFVDRGGVFQQSLAVGFPKHHKRYIIPVGATTKAVGQSNMIYQSVQDDWFKFNNGFSQVRTREISPKIVREQYSISAHTQPKTFQFKRTVSIPERKEQPPNHFPVMRARSVVKRSTTLNSSTSKQRYPTPPLRSVSMSTYPEKEKERSPEQHSGLNRRLLKALVSMRKYRKDATLDKHSNEN
ncbi:ABI family [Parasponia andersonii]|uniref:ABI family n=1 Tax=Parasponia andersonii TaxID=3476 RepID=A0A2P5A754_PARAD|nr:ABI family [Parasponia andersonii]